MGPQSLIILAVIVFISILPFSLKNGGPGWFVLTYLVGFSLWLGVVRSIRPLPTVAILVIATLCRLLFLVADPGLSTDVFRYRWDGRVAVSGVNPYAFSPSQAPPEGRPVWFSRINHPEIPTIYPPLAELLFFLWVRCWDGLPLWRMMMLLFDLATVATLASSHKNMALVYALCPFVVIEGFWSAHLEVAVSSALVLAVVWLFRRREVGSAIALAIAIGLKITPLSVFAEMIHASRRKLRFAIVAIASTLLPVSLFAGRSLMPGATEFARSWSFNSPLFLGLRWAVSEGNLPDLLKLAFTSFKDRLALEPVADLIYSHLYADFLTRVVLGLLWIAGSVFLWKRREPSIASVAEAFSLLILLSPTIHPWYFLPLVPLALLADRLDLTLLAGLSPVSYLLYQRPALQPLVFVVCYGIPLATGLFRPNASLSGKARVPLALASQPGSYPAEF